jgi:hypothetical protein
MAMAEVRYKDERTGADLKFKVPCRDTDSDQMIKDRAYAKLQKEWNAGQLNGSFTVLGRED